jgi:putative transcriptional regulator
MGKERIRNAIRRLRFEANEMTQQELADKAGVTRQAIISIESGKYNPSLELAFRIARAFGAGIEEVFAWDEGDGATDADESAYRGKSAGGNEK